jgi:hypothetical protein
MTRTWLAVALALALAGCASWTVWPFARPSAAALARADRLAGEGDYPAAVAAYDAFLAAHGDDAEAPRVRASRDSLAALLANREEMARLRRELAKLREDLARREGDLAKLRQEAERTRQEAERLRTDLERLKQIDLRLERRGKK